MDIPGPQGELTDDEYDAESQKALDLPSGFDR